MREGERGKLPRTSEKEFRRAKPIIKLMSKAQTWIYQASARASAAKPNDVDF